MLLFPRRKIRRIEQRTFQPIYKRTSRKYRAIEFLLPFCPEVDNFTFASHSEHGLLQSVCLQHGTIVVRGMKCYNANFFLFHHHLNLHNNFDMPTLTSWRSEELSPKT